MMAPRRRLLRGLLGVHRVCLHAYPSWFRIAHGEAMIATFEDLVTGSYRRAGAVGATRVAMAEYGSLLFRGMRERFLRRSPTLDGRPASNGRRQHEINFRERNSMYAIGNLQHTLRSLARTPGYTAAFVLTLGLGIGANTAIFSVINGVLLRPLPSRILKRVTMRTTSNPLLVVLALGALLTPPISAQDAPVLVSAEWLEEHLEDPSLVILYVRMGHDAMSSAFIPGAAFLDYRAITTTTDGLPEGYQALGRGRLWALSPVVPAGYVRWRRGAIGAKRQGLYTLSYTPK